MLEGKKFSLVKPTQQTPLHIDFEWWKTQEKNWRVILFSYLCTEHQSAFPDPSNLQMIDHIDPKTAEVSQVDGLQHLLVNHCAKQLGFATSNTSLVDSVFRVLLANENHPLSSEEIGKLINRPPETILKTLAGSVVYKGIRPVHS
jgi:hypothetical protein